MGRITSNSESQYFFLFPISGVTFSVYDLGLDHRQHPWISDPESDVIQFLPSCPKLSAPGVVGHGWIQGIGCSLGSSLFCRQVIFGRVTPFFQFVFVPFVSGTMWVGVINFLKRGRKKVEGFSAGNRSRGLFTGRFSKWKMTTWVRYHLPPAFAATTMVPNAVPSYPLPSNGVHRRGTYHPPPISFCNRFAKACNIPILYPWKNESISSRVPY